jgi:spore coat polysaccharide biosynthesis predicted glycosyltransferase SpsG
VTMGAMDVCERALAEVATRRPSACVLDGYVFTLPVQHQLRADCRLIVVDDLGAEADCELSVNPSVAPVAPPQGATAHLDAPDHALLSAADERARRRRATRPRAGRTVLVSAGGTDTAGLALRMATAIAGEDATADVLLVAGPETVLGDVPPAVRVAKQPRTLTDLLSESAVYAGAAGVTAVQAACIGVPMVLVATVDNQRPQARALADAGCALLVEDSAGVPPAAIALLDDRSRQERMSEAGRALVDGGGAARVAAAIIALVRGQHHAGVTA